MDRVEQESIIFLGDLNYFFPKILTMHLKFSYTNYISIGFNLKSTNQTLFAINGFGCGLQSRDELLIEITRYKGNIRNSNIITGQEEILSETFL